MRSLKVFYFLFFCSVLGFLFFAIPRWMGKGENSFVCDRTPQVREAIMAKIAEIDPEVDCSLADSLLNNITELDLSEQGISSLRREDFSGLSSLSQLELSFNNLSSLSVGMFSELPSLEQVLLSNNSFPEAERERIEEELLKVLENNR